MDLCSWWNENVYTNVFTIITVIVSGVISTLISALFFRKGNRQNLKVSVIHPLLQVLNASQVAKQYSKICNAASNYAVRYMNNKERKAFAALQDAFKAVDNYSVESEYVEVLLEHFRKIIEGRGYEFSPIPKWHDGEIIDFDAPIGYFDLRDNLRMAIDQAHPVGEPDVCQRVVQLCFADFAKEYYSVEAIDFFENISLEEVYTESAIHKGWITKIRNARKAASDFTELPIYKEIESKTGSCNKQKGDTVGRVCYYAFFLLVFLAFLIIIGNVYLIHIETNMFNLPGISLILTILLGNVAVKLYSFFECVVYKIASKLTTKKPVGKCDFTKYDANLIAIFSCLVLAIYLYACGSSEPAVSGYSFFLLAVAFDLFCNSGCNLKDRFVNLFWSLLHR